MSTEAQSKEMEKALKEYDRLSLANRNRFIEESSKSIKKPIPTPTLKISKTRENAVNKVKVDLLFKYDIELPKYIEKMLLESSIDEAKNVLTQYLKDHVCG